MTVAVLVMAYKEPTVLSMVVPVYLKAGFDVFVHLDAKASAFDYARAMGEQARHCRFVEPRSPIFWGGFTMVEATVRLLEEALRTKEYSNLLLVSDDTLPIVPVDRLRSALSTKIERISIRRVREDELFMQRYREFYFLDHPATSLLGRPIETSRIDDAFLQTFSRLLERRKAGKVDVPLFYSSQWWCLTAEAARTVLSIHAERADLRESFEFSAVPDEIYFQTLVGNYARANGFIQGPVYVDWAREPKPFVFSAFEDFAGAVSPDHMFIRKVSSQHRAFLDEAIRRVCSGR